MDLISLVLAAALLFALILLALVVLRRPHAQPESGELEMLRKTLNDRLYQDSQQTGAGLNDIRQRLALVQSAQAQLKTLSGQVTNLERTLGDRGARGLYGEQQLEELAAAILPPQRLAFQATLSNGKRPDLLIKLPNPPGPLVVDAKFPLSAFEELHSADTRTERRAAAKRLERHLIGHLKDIADRYILPGETADQAILFLPSDALFATVHAEARAAIEESHRRRVWITAPATLAATLTTLRAIVRDVETADNLSHIQNEIGALLDDLERATSAITALERHFGAAQRDIDSLRALRDSLGERAGNIAEPAGREIPSLRIIGRK